MSALGSLVVQLTLENAQFNNALDKSGQAAQRHAQTVGHSFDFAEKSANQYFSRVASGAVAAVAAYVGINAAIDRLSNSINTLAKLDDMAQKTGSSVENLSKIQKTVAAFGGSFEAVDTAIAKLAKGMGTVDSDTNKANNALKALGISSRDTAGNLRDPSQVMIEIAKNLQNYADGAGKTALATDLFGKSGQDILPILNDMADHVDRFRGVSAEAAQGASLLKDQTGLLNTQVDSLFTSAAMNLLPAMTEIASAFNSASVDTKKYNEIAEGTVWVLKRLIIGGATVGLVIDRMAAGIQTASVQLFKLTQLDFSGMTNAGRSFFEDSKESFAGYEQFVNNVLNGSPELAQERDKISQRTGPSAAAKPALNYQSGAAAASAASAKSATSEYDKLIGSIREKTAAQSLELTGQAKLTAGQKIANDAMTQLRDGTLKLTSAQKMKLTGELENLLATEQSVIAMQSAKKATDDLSASAKKATDDLFESGRKQVDSVQQQLDAQREQNALVGLSEEQIVALTGAKDLELAANLRNAAVYAGDMHDAYMIYASDLERAAALQKELVSEKAIAARFADLDRIGASVERTLEQSLVMFAANGAKAGKAILESFKMTFIKGVYEFAARPIALRFVASITGAMTAGAANAAGGGAMDSLFNAAGLMNAGKMLWTGFSGGIASGLGSIVGGIGSMIGSSALAAFGGGLAATGTGAAAITGASAFLAAGGSGAAMAGGAAAMAGMGAQLAALAGPLAAVAAIGTLLYMGFKKKKTVLGQGIQGEFGEDGFVGKNYVDMKSDSLFTKAKYYQNTTDLSAQTTARMSQAMALLRSSTTEYASVLSLPVDAIAGYTTKIKVALTGDETKDKAALDAMFLGIADSLAGLTGNFDKFIQEGETAATTLKRLATEFASVDAVLHSIGMTFGQVGLESMEARERLINLAGGLDALQQKTAFYAQNFLTEAERLAPVQADVTAAMAAMGYAGVTTKQQFADVVKGLELTSESGAKTYAGLMNWAQAFATVADAADASNDALIARYKTVVGATFQALQRAVDAERSSVQKHIDEITGSISKLTSLSGTLQATLGRMHVAGTAGADRLAAQAQISGALAIARASGVLPSAESLAGALDVVAQPSEQLFGSFVEYMQDFARTAADINSLDSLTQGQLTIEQQALSTAQGQLTALDGILAKSQAQIDAINGVNVSVMSVAAAVAGMHSAFGGPGATAAAALGATTSGLGGTPSDAAFVTSLYNTLLGRAPDAAGLAGWEAQLAAGKSVNDVIKGFTGSQEYMARVPKFAAGGDHAGGWAIVGDGGGPELVNMPPGRVYSHSASQKMLDFSAVVAKLEDLRKQVEKMSGHTEQTASNTAATADMLDRVSAGGGPLLVEVV